MYTGAALSVCLYALGLQCTPLTAWGSCFFLAPLLIAVHRRLFLPRVWFTYGMLMGVITYYACFIALFEHVHWHGALVLTIAALWWYGTGFMLWLLSIAACGMSTVPRCIGIVVITGAYYYYLTWYWCPFFVRWCGLPMSVPLVPLMSYSSVQWAVSISASMSLITLITLNCAIAHAWVRQRFTSLFFLILLTGVCLQLPFQPPQSAVIPIVHFLDITETPEQTIDEKAHIIGRQLGRLCAQKPVDIIVSNETVFNENLAAMPAVIELWYEYGLARNAHLFIGAYHKCAGALHNSIYWIHQGRIQAIYHKQLVIPGIETDYIGTRSLPVLRACMRNQSFACAPSRTEVVWQLPIGGVVWCVAPRVCADLFFIAPPPGAQLMVGVVNQHWCRSAHFRRLLDHTVTWWQCISGAPILHTKLY